MRLRWECIPSPSQLLLLPLFLFFAVDCSLSALITNVISTEGGALRRRSGEIPLFRLLLLQLPLPFCSCLCRCCCSCPCRCCCSCPCRCCCSCPCPCRCCCSCLCCCSFYVVILSAAKNPRIFKGSAATRVPFSPTTPTPSFRPERLTVSS